MSENDNEDMPSKLEAMNKKLSSMNKIVKTILQKLENICGGNEAVEQKSHGKPQGSTFEERTSKLFGNVES